jgi:anti-sigma-K factor RskA
MTEEDDIDGLAGEYVLGSLDPDERRDVDARRKTDPALHQAIQAWERRFGPLSERAPEVTPPAHLYGSILTRIDQHGATRSAEIVPLRRGGSHRWSLAAVTSALAACLALAAGWYNYTHVGTPGATSHARMDCGGLYKDFWVKFDRSTYQRISADQLAAVSRMALRAHDACQAGDDQDARALFDRLRRIQY